MGGPLSGMTVVEFEGKGPAPFACRMLADLDVRWTDLWDAGTPGSR